MFCYGIISFIVIYSFITLERRMTIKSVLYTHPECNYSDIFRSELNEDNIEYEEIDLSIHPEKWDELDHRDKKLLLETFPILCEPKLYLCEWSSGDFPMKNSTLSSHLTGEKALGKNHCEFLKNFNEGRKKKDKRWRG